MQTPTASIFINGLSIDTGRPLGEGLTIEDIYKESQSEVLDDSRFADLYEQSRRQAKGNTRAPIEGVDANLLEQAGWGIVLSYEEDQAVIEQLKPLLDLRKQQAGALYQEFQGARGVLPGETKDKFLKRQNAPASGLVNPRKIPYYLLLVGSPEKIPLSFQYALDVQYAVGRIHFDQLTDYGEYARAVVAAERGECRLARRAMFLGVAADEATELSRDQLVLPLVQFTRDQLAGWEIDLLAGEQASKQNLLDYLRRPDSPAFLFTASHGVGYKSGASSQYDGQGALVMDWAGRGPIPEQYLFRGADVDGLRIRGLISFHFACFSAGTPDRNNFYGVTPQRFGLATYCAEKPFLAALPKRLLANGALAVVGHIDTTLSFSFTEALSCYTSTIQKLAAGGRIGLAMDYFNLRHAELSVGLTTRLDKSQSATEAEQLEIARRWLQNNDARNYIIIGDPAVRLAADSTSEKEIVNRRIADLEAELERLKRRLAEL